MRSVFILIFLLYGIQVFGQEPQTTYEEVSSFYPDIDEINQQEIKWGMFTVPENWDIPSNKKIKLAVAILNNTSNKKNADAVVMIEGGPGASAIEGIWWWLNHPLRKTHNIILVDSRGTGFSEPRLCPNLGKDFLNILAKNQPPSVDEKEKAEAALKCKQSLIAKGIDINNYTSKSIAKDIHVIKEHLKYLNWNVYGVSYGTYIAQTYTKIFPNDVKALILDSPISDISEYYTLNTSNYVSSLEKVFKACNENPECNSEYPDLENLYYKIIKELKENPITIKVDKDLIPNGEFTYNAEDFKIAIHQALYQERLVEVLPLLINQFHKRNEATLSALVTAFSGALALDYGVYYCVTCNEAIPKNSFDAYNEDIEAQKQLSEGLSFYRSDFIVCSQWNKNSEPISKNLDTISQKINVPTLIFTGGFDPIIPSKNGNELVATLGDAQLIEASSYGHAPSFSRIGFKIVSNFINNPKIKVEDNFNENKMNFVRGIHINGGVSKMGNSLNNPDVLFFIPLAIAILISLIAIFAYTFSVIKKKKQGKLNITIKIFLVISSLISMLIIGGLLVGLSNTASKNFYILAFGLPENYSFVFKLLIPFVFVLLILSITFLLGVKKIKNRSILFTVLFSNILIATYLLYWGFY